MSEEISKMERIILGDDHLDFAKKAMPYIPGAEVDYVDHPVDLMEKVMEAEQPYDLVISDYDYGPRAGVTGLDVFRYFEKEGLATAARKILWTGLADAKQIMSGAQKLGIEVLDKDELGTIVGLAVSKAPIKQSGSVLVYSSDTKSSKTLALKQTISTLFDDSEICVSGELEEELRTGKYGLVIDTTTLGRQMPTQGSVAHDMKYFDLEEVPKVMCVYQLGSVVADIGRIASDYLKETGQL